MTETQPPLSGKSIVLVGASVRAAAQSAQRAGFGVIGIDLFCDRDTVRSCDRIFRIPAPGTDGDQQADEVLEACADLPVLAVGGLFGHHDFIRRLFSVARNIGPTLATLGRLQQPAVLQSIAQAAGVQVPTTLRSASAWDRPDRIGTSAGGWLAKRPQSSGGLGVRWWEPGDCCASDSMLQQWVPGRLFGATYLSDGTGVQLIGVCRSLFTRKGSRPFIYAGSVGPVELPSSVLSKLDRLGRGLTESLSLTGLFNADVIVGHDDQVWLLEINPRWSGSSEIIELGIADRAEQDSIPSLMGLSLERDFQRPIPTVTEPGGKVWIKRILYSKRDRRFRFAELAKSLAVTQTIHDVPAEGAIIRRGDPLVTLLSVVDRDDRRALENYRRARRQME